MGTMGMFYVQNESGESNRVASKPEIHMSQLVDNLFKGYIYVCEVYPT